MTGRLHADDQTPSHTSDPIRRALAVCDGLSWRSRRSPTCKPAHLNADIINNGVVKGDTGYIIPDRRPDAARHVPGRRVRDRGRLLRFEDGRWRSGETCAARSSEG